MIRQALLATLLVLAACASDGQRVASSDGASGGGADLSVARDLAFSHTYEVRFQGSTEPDGYLVEFYRVPAGIRDERIHKPGTALVQDAALATVGLITPGGRGYAFDAQGVSQDLGFGSRSALVAELLGGLSARETEQMTRLLKKMQAFVTPLRKVEQ